LDISRALAVGSGRLISGAYVDANSSGDAVNNRVTIEMGGASSSSSVTGPLMIAGGMNQGSGDTKENKLFVSCKDSTDCGTVNATNLAGGFANSGNATDNLMSLSGAVTTTGDVYAGFSISGNADNNTAYLTGSSNIAGNVIGGRSQGGDADNNDLVLENFEDDSSGSNAFYGGYTGLTTGGTAVGNTVTVRGESTLK
jgi:hypothetical protein